MKRTWRCKEGPALIIECGLDGHCCQTPTLAKCAKVFCAAGHKNLGFPGHSAVNQLSFLQAVNGFGQRVVIAVTPAAVRRLYPCRRQPTKQKADPVVSSSSCGVQAVTHAVDGSDGAVAGASLLQFAAYIFDVTVDCTVADIAYVLMQNIQQSGATKDLTRA